VLLSSTSFQLPDLGRVTPTQIAAFERYLGSTSVVQVGGGNTAPTTDGGTSTASTAGGAPATIVQNTLNNQSIQTRTVIDATTNALSLARGVNTAAALRDALTRAVPGR
jgi:hypothetical protein